MAIIVPPPIQYVDASYFQTTIDVSAYRAGGFTRIAHRATYRNDGVDAAFSGRWSTFGGLTRQAYHFAYDSDTPDIAAAHFLDTVNRAGGFASGDEAMLDCEWFQTADGEWVGLNPAHGKQYAAIWNAAVAGAEPNVRRFFYGNAWWFEAAGITAADFPNVGMITASYGANYRTPNGWPHSCIWQYTDRATVPGFPGEPVDFNQVTCPSDLDHLTIGDDMSQADVDAIVAAVNAHTQEVVHAYVQALAGDRAQNADGTFVYSLKRLKTQTDSQQAQLLGPTPAGQKTPASLGQIAQGVVDSYTRLSQAVTGLPAAISDAVVAHVPAGSGLDVAALTNEIALVVAAQIANTTVTLTPKANL
jgi:GH25 family lysozyme M1 (1,4-beta-N-acetylmuramidase)